MSDISEGHLPSRFHVNDERVAIARLARSEEIASDEPPKVRADGTADRRYNNRPVMSALEERAARGDVHVIEFIRFGPDRFTTCGQCDFTCTGDTNEAMALTWNAHSRSMRRLPAHGRSGPVERVIPAADADEDDDDDELAETG